MAHNLVKTCGKLTAENEELRSQLREIVSKNPHLCPTTKKLKAIHDNIAETCERMKALLEEGTIDDRR